MIGLSEVITGKAVQISKMDIRNITQAPDEVDDHQLEAIYQLQKDLMEGYIGKIEKDLPPYPIDVNSRKGQAVLKDMSARVIEEIGEGYESTGLALELLGKYGMNKMIMTKEDHQMLLNHLQNSNEEQADAFAFYVELFLYSNVFPDDIYRYVEKVLFDKYKFTNLKWERNLDCLMQIGLAIFNDRFDDIKVGLYHVLESFDFDTEDEANHVISYIPAFHKISWAFHDCEAKMAWEVAAHISIARNFLKNKPWKQTGVMTDERRYQEEIVLGFIKYMGYLKYCGFTAQSIYVLFFKKHMVNVFRQKSQY